MLCSIMCIFNSHSGKQYFKSHFTHEKIRGTESFRYLLKIIQLVRGKENVETEIQSLA